SIASDCPITQPVWNEPYSVDFDSSGGLAPTTWSIVAGALPPGLILDPATGVISGTPGLVGTFNYTLQVEDLALQTATITCAFVIANPCPPCEFTKEAERACDFTQAAERAC